MKQGNQVAEVYIKMCPSFPKANETSSANIVYVLGDRSIYGVVFRPIRKGERLRVDRDEAFDICSEEVGCFECYSKFNTIYEIINRIKYRI